MIHLDDLLDKRLKKYERIKSECSFNQNQSIFLNKNNYIINRKEIIEKSKESLNLALESIESNKNSEFVEDYININKDISLFDSINKSVQLSQMNELKKSELIVEKCESLTFDSININKKNECLNQFNNDSIYFCNMKYLLNDDAYRMIDKFLYE